MSNESTNQQTLAENTVEESTVLTQDLTQGLTQNLTQDQDQVQDQNQVQEKVQYPQLVLTDADHDALKQAKGYFGKWVNPSPNDTEGSMKERFGEKKTGFTTPREAAYALLAITEYHMTEFEKGNASFEPLLVAVARSNLLKLAKSVITCEYDPLFDRYNMIKLEKGEFNKNIHVGREESFVALNESSLWTIGKRLRSQVLANVNRCFHPKTYDQLFVTKDTPNVKGRREPADARRNGLSSGDLCYTIADIANELNNVLPDDCMSLMHVAYSQSNQMKRRAFDERRAAEKALRQAELAERLAKGEIRRDVEYLPQRYAPKTEGQTQTQTQTQSESDKSRTVKPRSFRPRTDNPRTDNSRTDKPRPANPRTFEKSVNSRAVVRSDDNDVDHDTEANTNTNTRPRREYKVKKTNQTEQNDDFTTVVSKRKKATYRNVHN